jgi:hypothetical protein
MIETERSSEPEVTTPARGFHATVGTLDSKGHLTSVRNEFIETTPITMKHSPEPWKLAWACSSDSGSTIAIPLIDGKCPDESGVLTAVDATGKMLEEDPCLQRTLHRPAPQSRRR